MLERGNLEVAGAERLTAPAVAPADPATWQNPQLSCDIVMKGGITSGVVYPEAVVRLAQRYRFCGIGGTSAGAIAAVALAAAEYGRPSGGMSKLAAIPKQLAGTNSGAPFILSLFQPERETRPLFETALAFQRGRLSGIGSLLRWFWRFPVVAAVLAVAAIVLGFAGAVRWSVAVAVLAVAPWILLLGIVRDMRRALGALAENDFGLCRLGPRDSDPQALTEWLHELIQDLAGRDADAAPLTFADLWGVSPLPDTPTRTQLDLRRERIEQLSWQTHERKIDLQVVTTNLTQGRPISLPMLRDRWEDDYSDGGLLFDDDEWRQFFPKAVVDHMVEQRRPLDDEQKAVIADQAPGRRLVSFTFSGELPILVAARMSLSFPVLISTVPLWQIEYRRGRSPRLRRMVFSDGGISSNFPVQFFDSPLPTRPTFAVNLAGFEDDEHPDLDNPADCVRLPAKTAGRAVEIWKQPVTMMDFLLAIKDAMQNWRDNAQAQMPGLRERVIHIKLASGEGGLNLAMDEEKVTRLTKRGGHAGNELMLLFSGSEKQPVRTRHWNDHRYARFRTYMASMERLLEELHRAYFKEPDAASMPYPQRIEAGAERKPYQLTEAQLALAIATLDDHLKLTDELTISLDDGAPRPKGSLRNVPRL